jgi:hypothetical protein
VKQRQESHFRNGRMSFELGVDFGARGVSSFPSAPEESAKIPSANAQVVELVDTQVSEACA